MGLFSKLNFRAVHEAYCDIAAIGFLTELNCQLFNAMTEPDQSVKVSSYVDYSAQIIANSISEITDGSGLAHSSAISRLSEVSSSYKRLLNVEFGDNAEILNITKFCWGHFNIVSQRIFRSIHKGYLSMSAFEVQMLIEKNEERMNSAGMEANERIEVYLAELERKISELESQFHNAGNTKELRGSEPNSSKINIIEKSDRAIHGRSGSQPVSVGDCNSDTAISTENSSDKEIIPKQTTTRRGFNEKTDRAIHGRTEISSNRKISNTQKLSTEVSTQKDTGCAYFAEPFDLIDGNGRLQAKIGLKTINGFHILFNDEALLPLSKTQIFSTSEDNQSGILIPLAMQFGDGQIINIGNYKIDGIFLESRGIPEIEITIEIKNFEIKIKALDSLRKSNIRIIKEA